MMATLFAVGAMATLHPVASPLFFLAAVTAVLLGITGNPQERRRMLAWGVFFALAAAAKFMDTMLFASDYERANMQAAAWWKELSTGLIYSPFVAVAPVLVDVALRTWISFKQDGCARPVWLPRISRILWVLAFVLGICFSLFEGGWSSALNYRKFGIVVTAPIVLLSAADAVRLRRNSGKEGPHSLTFRINLLVPAALFAVIFIGLSLSWRGLWGTLQERMNTDPGPVVTAQFFGWRERNSALNHWSSTSLSLILQGWKPRKVFIFDPKLQFAQNGFQICPGSAFNCEDQAFKIAWLHQLAQESKKQTDKR
jgi:hypothetical protein